jgi:hypothetical protein
MILSSQNPGEAGLLGSNPCGYLGLTPVRSDAGVAGRALGHGSCEGHLVRSCEGHIDRAPRLLDLVQILVNAGGTRRESAKRYP